MQDKPHIAANKARGKARIRKTGRFADLIMQQQYNSPYLCIFSNYKRFQFLT